MRNFRQRLGDEAGIALITVMLVGAVLAGMGILIVSTTITDLRSANSDRASARTLDVAEAGVSDAISYIRSKGVKQICGSCGTITDWNTGHTIPYPRGQAVVSIVAINPYKPPQVRVGHYSITSVGTTTGSGASGSGQVAGKRTVQELVDVRPLSFPLGVYTASQVNLGGTVNMMQESLFSGSCVDSRSKLVMVPGPTGSNIDPFYNIPAAVHSTSYITDKNTSCLDPASADSQAIHKTSTCSSTYPADQDTLGGYPYPAGVAGDACRNATSGYGDYDTNGSNFSNTTFVNTYGFLPRGLSDDDYAQLKAKAIAAGTYFPAGTSIVWPTASTDPANAGYNPVIYIQNQNATIQSGDLSGYAWTSDPTCTQNHPTAVVIVDHGDLNISSGASLSGFIFVPDGNIKFTGSPTVIGTMFSKSLDWSGGSTVGLNDCFAANTNGGILNVTKYSWREVDS
jgi:hypothetical protein